MRWIDDDLLDSVARLWSDSLPILEGEKVMIIECIGEPAMLEQLAEECMELGKAALRKARVIRDENPTPVTIEEADKNLIEETTDVMICLEELKLNKDPAISYDKRKRFLTRWEEKLRS
jgi:hypothetical protein